MTSETAVRQWIHPSSYHLHTHTHTHTHTSHTHYPPAHQNGTRQRCQEREDTRTCTAKNEKTRAHVQPSHSDAVCKCQRLGRGNGRDPLASRPSSSSFLAWSCIVTRGRGVCACGVWGGGLKRGKGRWQEPYNSTSRNTNPANPATPGPINDHTQYSRCSLSVSFSTSSSKPYNSTTRNANPQPINDHTLNPTTLNPQT